MPHIPYKPNREDDHSNHHADIHERLFEGIGLLRAGAGILIEWDGSQYKITSTARGGGGTAATNNSGWNARGVWVSGTSYNTNDAVTMGSGVSSGLFLSLIDNNLNAPDSGVGWWQIGGTLWL